MAETQAVKARPFGRWEITIEGKKVTLRRPTAGEFKDFQLRLLDLQDENREIKQLRERLKDGEVDEATAEAAAAALDPKVQRESVDWAWEHIGGFMRHVIDTLAEGGSLPDDQDDWPMELLDPRTPGAFVQHWRGDPLVPGPS
jgi:hypothetical protein